MFLIKIGQKLIFPLMILVCIMLIIMLQMGFILLLIALLPSIAAFFVDTDYERINFRTIFACNVAATIPTITPVFLSGLKFKHYDVTSIIVNPKVWLFIYSGAAVGWVMIHFGGQVAHAFLEIQYKFRNANLEKSQERLLEEWGDTIKPRIEEKMVKKQ